MAEVVASAHNGYKTSYMRAADALWNDIFIGLCGRKFYVDGLVSTFYLSNQVG